MPEWRISTTMTGPVAARRLAAETHPPLRRASGDRRTYLIAGTRQAAIAACAASALDDGHRVVLLPGESGHSVHGALPVGTRLQIGDQGVATRPLGGSGARDGWDLAMFSSGSTTGNPRGYGFIRHQLDTVTAWYESIYQTTRDSVIITALPAAYNFTFVAGALLAARLGARLHLADTFRDVLLDAVRLAATADRVVVLANPVVLDQVTTDMRLPGHVLIDSGGAPLSTTAITYYRSHGVDVREGYGLTETASLTHFDTEAVTTSVGTVGTAMPSVGTTITTEAGRPIIEVTTPAVGVPLDPAEPPSGPVLRTTDLGHIDDHGRLRILGRADDYPIGGLWPRDTLDALGPVLGQRCALVRHLAVDQVTVHVLAPANPETFDALKETAAGLLGLPLDRVAVTSQGQAPLLHSAKLTRTPNGISAETRQSVRRDAAVLDGADDTPVLHVPVVGDQPGVGPGANGPR
ncbi:AMP-binding protein [Sphaerisporangium sp. NPDC051017]|uniref:AMP-binding protein n=1 Tax=Sphaerisporangium sp. NPDC051017 TaxID=3154636 RepID=UPI003439400D